MNDIGEFVRSVGSPIAFALALGYALYKVGAICGTLLIDAWKSKDTRLAEFDMKLERINNGQREALLTRLDMSMESQKLSADALAKVSEVLERQSHALEFFAQNRPCIHDSDLTLLNQDGTPLDEKAVVRVVRRAERKQRQEGDA